ncbi:MAG TPA: MFS transporter [Acetobacteraceae bacterium]|jgi:SHS family lactate transporter-like MFS transporter|nr:MFS transporter [Acetobacteraceae bacterium]
MSASANVQSVPWWKEPTKDQWIAWWAAWLGWTLDAFDFTIFLLIMVPISQEFGVPLVAVTAVFTITLWLRLLGATASGWLADRIGRKTPLMISILWFSMCNFIAGFAPNFAFLFFFRALLGIGMGAEWPAGASLAMESWPVRSRGFMSGVLQGSWGLGFLLSSAVYGLLFAYVGWRGMLWIGILPALAVIWVRRYVKEPAVWLENRRKQRAEGREMRLPLLAIFKRQLIFNTLTACWWMASCMVTYYSIWGLFATHLQKDLGLSPGMIATPVAFANLIGFLAMGFWGWIGDVLGRRWSMIIPAAIGLFVTPTYLITTDPVWIIGGFLVQGLFAGAMYSQMPSYLTERFPTEVRATASGFCFHQATIFGGLVPPVLTYFAINNQVGFAIPMLIGTTFGLVSVIAALLVSPETKGHVFQSDLVVS